MTINTYNEPETETGAGAIDTEQAQNRLLGAFSDWLKGGDFATPYSEATIRAYSRCARQFIEFAASMHLIHVSEATPPTIRAFVNEQTQNVSASTRNLCISAVDAFFDFLEFEGIREGNPVKKYRAELKKTRRGGRASKRLPAFLYPKEVDRLIDTLFARNHANRLRDLALIGLILDSGLRSSEVQALRVKDATDLIDNGVLRVIGKGDKERLVRPLDRNRKHLVEYLESLADPQGGRLDPGDRLFRVRTGAAMRQCNIHHIVQRAVADAGIVKPQTGPHLLRHTAATLMLASGMSMRRVQDNLGHASLNTTQLYTHLVDVEPAGTEGPGLDRTTG
ncbi:tyrosine-type recombinase/integrase [Thioalkalivibrio sp. ALgr3]|uniref:tyrosine-type recombinase/integrase n=1 Tax=Thioalkalivibrio sp. ALgr3 TaxID=1239292 RepID=UPI00036F391E|nr:tyrosine-type recombinase/integrase [Thioalkalivibrio sp. ALgr3]